MFIAIRKQLTPKGEPWIVFNNEAELVNWCVQVGRATIAEFSFRKLGDTIHPKLTATVTL